MSTASRMTKMANVIIAGGGAAPIMLMPRVDPPTRTRIVFHVGYTALDGLRYIYVHNELLIPAGVGGFSIWPNGIIVVKGAELCSNQWYASRVPANPNTISWMATYEPVEPREPGETEEAPPMNEEDPPEEKKPRKWWIFKW